MKKKYNAIIVLFFVVIGGVIVCCHEAPKKSSHQEKIDSLTSVASQVLSTDPLSARTLYNEALALETDSTKWYALLATQAFTYLYTAEFDTIDMLFDRIYTRLGNRDDLTQEEHYIMGRAYNMKSFYKSRTSETDSIIWFLENSLKHFILSGKQVSLPEMYLNMGDNYLRTGNYIKAISTFREGLSSIDSTVTKSDLRPVLHTSMGETYSDLKNYEMADYYFDLAFNEHDNLLLLQDKFSYYNNRGKSYYTRGEPDKALPYIREAFSLVKNNPEFQYQNGIAKGNLGEIFLISNKLDSAQYYLKEATVFFQKTSNSSGLYHMETLRFELAIRSKELSKARQIMAAFSSDEKIDPTLVRLRKKFLQHYYETVNDYANAYKYLKENTALDDSISSTLIKMRAEETDMRYRHDANLVQQAHLIERQQVEMKSLQLNRYIWIMAAGLLLLTAAFIYLYMRRQRVYLAEKHRNRIVGLRMENIRNRVSPHFIFNVLNHIISRFDRDDESYQKLFNLIKLMRMNLTMTEKLNISLEEELDFVETYVLSRRQESRIQLDFNIEIDKLIKTGNVEIPSMIIQIPVENSIKHGFREKEGNNYIKIVINKSGTNTEIRIEDNGNGFSTAESDHRDMQSTGTGLRVITQTIELLNSYNKNKISFTIENKKESETEEGGCIVTYIIPDDYNYNLN